MFAIETKHENVFPDERDVIALLFGHGGHLQEWQEQRGREIPQTGIYAPLNFPFIYAPFILSFICVF